jgi:hypothetical protein
VSINNDALATVETQAFIRFWNGAFKKYKQAGMPQQACLGIEYRDPKYWWIGTIYYLADNYIDVSIARTDGFILILPAISFPEATEERARIIEPRKI